MQRHNGRGLRIIGGLALVLTLALTIPVSAHALYKSSNPPANGTVPQAPRQVMIIFSEETDPLKSGGSVADPSGAPVSTGFKVDLNERTQMTIDLKPNLPDGVYTVTWNTFTDDDNGVADGAFTFMVQAVVGTGTATIGGTPAVATMTTSSPASETVAAGSVTASTQPTATTAPTAAPTTTRAAAPIVATGTGRGAVATRVPTTLPHTGQTSTKSKAPGLLWRSR